MGCYNEIYFWTLLFPITTMLAITMAGYLSMKTKYIECRLKYDVEFRNSEKGQKYIRKNEKTDRVMEIFKYKHFD